MNYTTSELVIIILSAMTGFLLVVLATIGSVCYCQSKRWVQLPLLLTVLFGSGLVGSSLAETRSIVLLRMWMYTAAIAAFVVSRILLFNRKRSANWFLQLLLLLFWLYSAEVWIIRFDSGPEVRERHQQSSEQELRVQKACRTLSLLCWSSEIDVAARSAEFRLNSCETTVQNNKLFGNLSKQQRAGRVFLPGAQRISRENRLA